MVAEDNWSERLMVGHLLCNDDALLTDLLRAVLYCWSLSLPILIEEVVAVKLMLDVETGMELAIVASCVYVNTSDTPSNQNHTHLAILALSKIMHSWKIT